MPGFGARNLLAGALSPNPHRYSPLIADIPATLEPRQPIARAWGGIAVA